MGFLKSGKLTESNFCKEFRKTSESTEIEDITEHWDIKVETKIDVKGLKKIKRTDVFNDENYHYVEIVNVNGDLGWLYGDCDAFAFETFTHWIIVDKKILQEFISKTVIKFKVDSPDKALYCLYSREGRKDKITLVKTLDLVFIASDLIKKTENIVEHIIGDSIDSKVREKQLLSRALNK